jgi:Flp pilus assembly protein TadG
MKRTARLRLGWLRLLRSERGSSVIELSALSPMLLSMVLGLIDASLGFTAKLKLQQAATRSIEMATAGGIASPAFNSLADEAATASGVSKTNITVTKWLECNGTRQDSFDAICASGQQYARYVSVTINGNYTPMLSSAMHAFGLPGTLSITGKASVRMQ